MTITIYENGEVFTPDKLIGFVGETAYRKVNFVFSTVTGADEYKLRLLYKDGLIYEIPIDAVSKQVTLDGSVLRESGRIQAQWIAYTTDDITEEYTLVAKSQTFELVIGQSIGDDASEIPTYEAIMAAAEQLVEDGMTREEVITAIQQIVETGEVQDLDTGFITTLKEIHNGCGLRVWLGTTAEFEALQTNNLLEQNVLYIRTDDKSVKFIGEIDPTTPLLTIITTYGNYLSYRLSVIPNTNIYPITLTAPTQNSNAAVVTMQKSGSAGYFTFEYGGDVWIAHFYASSAQGGYTIGSWKKLAQEETDTGWITLDITPSMSGFSAPTSGNKIPSYRKIGNHVYVQGFVMVNMDEIITPDVNAFFAQFPSGYRPSHFFYLHAPGQGAREAGVLVDQAGYLSMAYLKDSTGTNVTTGEYWIQLDCDFLTD